MSSRHPWSFLVLVLVLVLVLAGCGGADYRKGLYTGADGRTVPVLYRHEITANDTGSRAPLAGALVGVKSGLDPVWQVDFTDASGSVALVQQYHEPPLREDEWSLFYDVFGKTVRVRGAEARTIVRMPDYQPYQTFTAPFAKDLGPDVHAWPLAAIERTHPALIEPVRGPGGAPITPTADRRPTLAMLTEIAVPDRRRLEGGEGGLRRYPVVHEHRFARTNGGTSGAERALKLYRRGAGDVYVLLAPLRDDDNHGPRQRALALCETADAVLRDANKLDATIAAGKRRVALVYPPELCEKTGAWLLARGFEVAAEWWLPLPRS